MNFEEKALAYCQYALDLEEDGYDGIAFTPTEFFENLDEDYEGVKTPEYVNEAFKWDLR